MFFKEGAYLAIYSNEEPFWIAQCKERITNSDCNQKYKICWLERSSANKTGTSYTLGPSDTILAENIICEIRMIRLSRFKLFLSLPQEKIILCALITNTNSLFENSLENIPEIINTTEEHKTVSPKFNENLAENIKPLTKDVKNEPPEFKENLPSKKLRKEVVLNDGYSRFLKLDTASIIELKNFRETESISSGSNILLTDLQKQTILDELPCTSSNNSNLPVRDKITIVDPLQTSLKLENRNKSKISDVMSDSEEEPFQSSGSEYIPTEEKESSTSQEIKDYSEDSPFKILIPQASSSPIKERSSKLITRVQNKPSVSSSSDSAISNEQSSSSSQKMPQSAFIQCVQKSKSGSRVYDKKHACYFCDKLVGKISRHFQLIHKNETEIVRLLVLDPKSQTRKDGFLCLLRIGDYYHNCQVLATKSGELILTRRPRLAAQVSDYGPCPNCLGFFQLNMLWRHVKHNCPKKDKNKLRKDIKGESYALLSSWSETNTSFDFQQHIMATFRRDEISEICKQDEVIIKLGALMYEKFSLQQHEYIRQTMRQLGRLVLQIQNLDNKIISLAQAILPEHFDTLIKAVRILCQATVNQQKAQVYGVPSLALKIGHHLRKCAQIIRGTALRQGDLTKDRNVKSFLDIMELEWSHRISSSAVRTLCENKMNCEQLLPVTEDLLKLNNYLDDVITCSLNNIELSVNIPENWTKLARATLSRLILFNKRRSGEASRMTLNQYSSRPDWRNQCTSELKESLTPLEKTLAETLTVVEVAGKSRKNPKVPILITMNIKTALNKLIETRKLANINPHNEFVFPKKNMSLNSLRGDVVLKKFALEAKLQKPELITSTKIRKYIATVVQVLDLKETEADWLAKHLGHDIRIHRDFYRLHQSAIELTKVSRILLAVDKGQVSSFAGKSLEEIRLGDLPDALFDSDYESEIDEPADIPMNNMPNNGLANEIPSSSGECDNYTGCFINNEKYFKWKILGSKGKQQNREYRKNKNTPKKWTSEEVACVLNTFKNKIKKGFLPGKTDCEKCMQENPTLFLGRNWTHIKFYIKNHLSNMKKKL